MTTGDSYPGGDYGRHRYRDEKPEGSAGMSAVTMVRVVGPNFVAGMDVANGKCVECAPILVKWCKGKTEDQLRELFRQKGWRASIINIDHVNQL